MKWITVTPEQVRAARLELQALETAGLTPDPMLRKLAAAVAPGTQRAATPQKRHGDSAPRSEVRERAMEENRRFWDMVRAQNARISRADRRPAPSLSPPLPPLPSASGRRAIDEGVDERRVQADRERTHAEYFDDLAENEGRQSRH